jgi:hypothetical protein
VEVSDTTIQDPALVDTIVTAHLPGQYYLLERALGPGITGVIRDSITLEPLEAEVQVTEHINPDINPRLSRPDYGRYRRLLAPGSYTLKFLKDDYITRTIYNVQVTNGGPTETDVLLVPLNPRPPAPNPSYPPDDTTLSDNMVTFIWYQSDYAAFYLYELAYDSLFDEMVHFDSTVSDTSMTVDSLEDSLYYWRVRGGNDNGWGPYSETLTFRVESTTEIDEETSLPRTLRLAQNYPNPFNASTEIRFAIPNSAYIRLDIYNVLGQCVERLSEGVLEPGEHSIVWDADYHPSGVYFLRLEADGRSVSIRMTLLK